MEFGSPEMAKNQAKTYTSLGEGFFHSLVSYTTSSPPEDPVALEDVVDKPVVVDETSNDDVSSKSNIWWLKFRKFE